MSGQGDERATRALHAALADGPCDILDLLASMRKGLGEVGTLREGVIHPLLHREVRSGAVVVAGFSERGLPLYARAGTDAPGTPELPAPGPLPPAVAKRALAVAAGVRDPAARGRVQADAVAHLQALEDGGKGHRFGSPRAARALLQRVDRGRPAVCVTAGAGDVLRRFVLHEGPWIGGAVLVFFLLKAFVVQVYRIPSASMVPTLLVGDRVVVFRLGGGTPDRWDIVTYERDGITYVKRVVGLPGEAIELRNGDVYADGELLVKPEALRCAMRAPLESWDFRSGTPSGWQPSHPRGDEETLIWRWKPAGFGPYPGQSFGNSFALRDGYLTLDGERGQRGTVRLVFKRGPGDRGNATAWTLEVGVQGLELREGELFEGEEPPVEEILASEPTVAPTGPVRLELSYVDGVLRARCGSWSWQGVRESRDEPLMPEIHLRGPDTAARRLALDRDLHYAYIGTHGIPSSHDSLANPHPVPAGSLFVLGDNTTNSTDSRSPRVGDIPLDSLVGPVSFRIWPPGRIGLVR